MNGPWSTGHTADEVIANFALRPHPFDGWFAPVDTDRLAPVRFHYLIRAGELAPWHATGSQLVLTHIDGAPLTVTTIDNAGDYHNRVLQSGKQSSVLVEADWWRTWESLGHWSLLIASVETREDFLLWSLAPETVTDRR